MPADTTTDTPEIVVRALTGSSTPTSSGPVVSVLTHPGYDLAEDYVEPAGGDWVSEFPIRVRADGKGVVNWTHAIPVGLGQVEHKAIAGDTGELILATGLTDFFQSAADLNGIDLTEYESPSSRTPIGRYTADECLRAAADAEALVRGGYATGVSIEFRPNGPKGSMEGEGAYWDREVKSPMLPRPGRHFKSWTGLAYAHARRPVNPGCHTVVNDLDVELVAKAIRVMETGKVGSHQLCDRVLKSFREDAPDLLELARAARRSTVTVEGVPPVDEVKAMDEDPEKEPGDLGRYIEKQFAHYGSGPDIENPTGYLLSDGTAVHMGHGDRDEDHRGAIPSHDAMQRWGWPADIVKDYREGTRTPAMHELMRRSGAARVHVGDDLFVHHATPLTGAQRRAISRFTEANPKAGVIFQPHGADAVEIGPWEDVEEAVRKSNNLLRRAGERGAKAITEYPVSTKPAVIEIKAKSDAWIKWKVRKLVAEGKPRKQAVAVAYSMAGRDTEAKAEPDTAAQPILAYHGSKNGDFDRFDPAHIGQNDPGFYGRGFYFTPDKEYAAEYGPAKPYHLNIRKPFTVPSSGTMGHDSLYDLRDSLAGLEGGPTHLKTNRTVPEGYALRSREVENRYHNPTARGSKPTVTLHSVEPLPHLYGTEHEVYGPEDVSPLGAVVRFNDQRSGVDAPSAGWASGLLKSATHRDELHNLLAKNGYDGIKVVDPDTDHTVEYVAFHPHQITPAPAQTAEAKAAPESTAPPTRTEFYAKVRKAWGGHPGGASFTGSYLRMRAGLSNGDIAHAKKQGWLVKSEDGEGHELHPSFNTRVAPWEPITAKSYTGPLRASGRLNANPNVEDEERGDDEPDFEIPGLDDEDSDRDTKAVRTPRYDPTASQYAQTAHRLTGEVRDLSRDVAPGMHKVATAALEASRLRDSATAITHLTKLADWHGKQARTAPPDTADQHAEAGMTARRALALHKMIADRGNVSGGAMQYTPDRIRSIPGKPSGFTPLPEFADRADTAHEVSRQVAGDAHRATRYAAMAARETANGNYEKAGGAHLGAVQKHLEALKGVKSKYEADMHLNAIRTHREAARKLHKHLSSDPTWVPPSKRDKPAAPTPSPARRPLDSGLEGSPYRPAVKPSAIDTATYEASNRQPTGPVEPAAPKRGLVSRLLGRFINKAFEDDVSDPYEVARIASGLAMKTGNDREAKATIARKSPAEMKAYHERAADNPRLDADAADRHLRAAEMWERAMVAGPARLGNGRPYMKARTDGFDVPAVALGLDEKPPASISALMNFAQLQMDGAEALAYDAQQSDDLMFRTYAKALATQAQTAAATLQKQASAMQQYLNGAANNGGMQKHPLMGMLNTGQGQAGDQNQPGTTTSGDVPPGADGTTTDDADDATANGAQKAFADDTALDSLFAEPVAVPDTPAGPEVDDDGWLVFKAFPEWKPRRYAMSELRDLPRANTGGAANKSAAANTAAAAVQTPPAPAVEAKADEWASPEVAAKLGELTAQLKKLKQLDEAVQHRQQRGGW